MQGNAASHPILRVRSISRHFGSVMAVNNVSFAIRRGTITGLIGPNGAGKSTVLNLIAGTERTERGEILFEGTNIARQPIHGIARRGLVRTFQLPSEFARLTVLENLMVAAKRQRGASLFGAMAGRRYWRRQERGNLERARWLLSRFGLAHAGDQFASELSGGQKRLLELARALMTEPTLLLLDEPLAGVNPALARTVEDHLVSLRDEGLTMILVEHELGAVERCTDTVIAMAQGRIIAEGTMSELGRDPEVVDAYLIG